MTSYWEIDQLLGADAIVIGAGIIGLSTAIELRELHPTWRVVVLERGLLPTGASTRNAGFACIGSPSEIWCDMQALGTDAALEVIERRWKGLRALRARCGGRDIGYEEHGGSEIFLQHHECLEHLDEINALMCDVVGGTMFVPDNDRIASYGMSATISTLIYTPFEGTLHSGKLMHALWSIAAERGVIIHTGALVTRKQLLTDKWEVTVQGVMGERTFHAGVVVECTNSAMETPGRGQVIVTEPLASLPLQGSFHYDEGYYYFRSLGNRVLLGGGRNLDFEAERTTSFDLTRQVQEALEELLYTVILPTQRPRIEHRWAGTMGFSATKQPRVERTEPGYVQAFGCNGMGVAIGTEVGRQAAALAIFVDGNSRT